MFSLHETVARSLKLRLILPMFVALLAATAGFAGWDYSQTRGRLVHQTQDEAARYAHGLRNALLGADDVPEMQRLVLATAIPNPSIELAVVAVGPHAKIIASSDPDLLGREATAVGHADLAANIRTAEGGEFALVHPEQAAVDHTSTFRFPAATDLPSSSRLGAVMLHYSLPELDELARHEAARSAGTMLLLVILFAAGAFYTLEKFVLSRLFRLGDAVAQFAQTRTIADLDLGRDEIGRLAAHILEKQRETASRERELATIVEASGDGIVFIDAEGGIVQFNRKAEEIFGCRAKDVLGQSFAMLMPSLQSQQLEDYMRRYLETGEPRILGSVREVEGRHRDGRAIPLSLSVAEIQSDTSRVFICVIRDLSDQRRAETNLKAYATALETATMRAESSAEAKAEFLANMSHEIRTPMTAILGYVDLLMDDHTPEHERSGYLKTVKQNGEHLLSLINDILDLSKIEADRVELERCDTDVADLVGSVVDLLRFRAKDKGIRLQAASDGPIPRQILTDPTRVRQILVNLVGNAIKFTELGGVTIRARYDAERHVLQLDVEDTGIGMAEDKLDAIFEAFGQAESSTTRKFGGTGLGLTISRKLARRLGGDIEVRSTLGQGSVFGLRLPLPPRTEEVELLDDLGAEIASRFDAAPEEPADSGASPTPTAARVLLAEDNPVNQKLIERFLQREGAEVFVVADGQQACTAALASLDGEPFDIVLMDMLMPVMDGYEATTFLRAHGYPGTIVALTANAMEGDRDKCLRAGCDDYLTKPLQHEEFRRVLQTYTRSPETTRA